MNKSALAQTLSRELNLTVETVSSIINTILDAMTEPLIKDDNIAKEELSQSFIKIRLSLIEYAISHTLDELMTQSLDEVGALLDSPIGFYHFVEPDQKTLSLQQWSTRTLKEFCRAEGKGIHYSIDQAGVWVDCLHQKKAVIHNDYSSLPHKKGMPEGHAKVVRELVVPVIRNDKAVAILGVGNKPTDYTQRDVEIVSYLADVTWEIVQKKRAEAELIQYFQRLKLATASGKLGVWDWNVEENVMVWDDRMFELYGSSRNTFQSNIGAWKNCLHPDDKQRAIDESNAALAGEKEFDTTFRVLHPDGTVKYLKGDGMIIRDPNGKAIQMIGINRDITESKLAEEELRRSQHELDSYRIELELQNEDLRNTQDELEKSHRRYADLYNFAPVAYLTVSEKGLILEANLTAATQLGVTRQSLIKKPLTSFIMQADQDIYYRHRKVLFETGAQQTCELRLLRLDSPPLWALLKATMSPDGEKGKPACRVVVADIHERKQAEEKLRIAYAELELRVQERTAQLSDANAALSIEMEEHKQVEEDLRKYKKG